MAYAKDKGHCTGQDALAGSYREGKSDIGKIADPSKSAGGQSSKGTIAPLPKIGRGK